MPHFLICEEIVVGDDPHVEVGEEFPELLGEVVWDIARVEEVLCSDVFSGP